MREHQEVLEGQRERKYEVDARRASLESDKFDRVDSDISVTSSRRRRLIDVESDRVRRECRRLLSSNRHFCTSAQVQMSLKVHYKKDQISSLC